MQRLGLAVQLVPEPLDVIHPIGNDYAVTTNQALHGRHFGGPRIFLGPRCMVDVGLQTQSLIIDEMHPKPCNLWVGRGSDAIGEVVHELLAAVCLARTRIARNDEQLAGSVSQPVSQSVITVVDLDSEISEQAGRHAYERARTGMTSGEEKRGAVWARLRCHGLMLDQADCCLAQLGSERVFKGCCQGFDDERSWEDCERERSPQGSTVSNHHWATPLLYSLYNYSTLYSPKSPLPHPDLITNIRKL
jgi:hypothetical protein